MVQDTERFLPNWPRSGRHERLQVMPDGNSRNRVEMCWHLKSILLQGEEEWYRGNMTFFTFSSL